MMSGGAKAETNASDDVGLVTETAAKGDLNDREFRIPTDANASTNSDRSQDKVCTNRIRKCVATIITD